jgi:hypothetical protein
MAPLGIVFLKVALTKNRYLNEKMMESLKKILIVMPVLFLSTISVAQIAVGKTNVEGAGLLDFGTGKGLILPWVETAASTDADGTLIFDTTDNKVKARINGAWVDLSENSGTLNTAKANKVSQHLLKTENDNNIILGSTTPSANGVLVLESTDKALILPKMASPHLNMVDPEPGTIVYDTDANLMCVFNGEEWTFWGE